MSVLATCLGFPRIGTFRELKKELERFWSGQGSRAELAEVAAALRLRHFSLMKAAGIDQVPVNDFSLYDHMLDMAVAVGAVPPRYAGISDPAARYFAMARGMQDPAAGIDVAALEMTKWFDTNYHYIVPELRPDQGFTLDATKIVSEIDEARALGIEPRPVIVGPVTFLQLSKLAPGTGSLTVTPLALLDRLLMTYEHLLALLAAKNIAWVQVDEPCLVLDLDEPTQVAYRNAFRRLAARTSRPRLLVTTYFGAVDHNLPLITQSGWEGVHIDLVRAPEQLDAVLDQLPSQMILSLGLVDGRNVWRADLDDAAAQLRRAVQRLGAERVVVGPSCSLLHVPVDLAVERRLDGELTSWLAFARQKLDEIRALADDAGASASATSRPADPRFEAARTALSSRRRSVRTKQPEVRARAGAVTPQMLRRTSGYEERARRQHLRFGLGPLPTTTIGSFPQTREVRAARAEWRAGRMTEEAYDQFLKEETRRCVVEQEAIGLNVLVHGELERNDMSEYFGERLEGFAFTENGWVQSYGSRCVKPPVLFGDVSRPRPMTVEWWRYAQSLTKQPMKGMLTGPVTILQWSFVRNDQPRDETCRQIALALRDEVADLEVAGAGMIQVDEPAIREGLPLRRRDFPTYLRWSVDAFRLATSGVRDKTQIHTHMCYSEFGDILEAISSMDADVLSIETSRSKMELLADFGTFKYPNEVGPGVYDIHAPRVPTVGEMQELLERAMSVLPPERLWVNPDCGLKTRGWPEVSAALRNMVEAARLARQRLAKGS